MDDEQALLVKKTVRICFPLTHCMHYEGYYLKKLRAFKHDNIRCGENFKILRMGLSTDGIAVDLELIATPENLDIITFYLEQDFSIPVMSLRSLPKAIYN